MQVLSSQNPQHKAGLWGPFTGCGRSPKTIGTIGSVSDRSKSCCWAARSRPLNRFEHKPLANTGLPFLLEAICCRTSCNRQLSVLSTANNLCDYSTNTTLTLEQIVWARGLLNIGWKANLHHSHGEKANTNGTKKMDRKQAAFPHSSPPVGFSSPLFAHTAVEAEVSRGEAFF